MNFKKVVSLMLGCVLVINSSINGFAFIEKDVDLTIKVNNLEKQLIKSETEKNLLKSKLKSAELNNQKAFEKNIEELKKQNKKLKKAIASNDTLSTGSWIGSSLRLFDILLKLVGLVTGGSLYLAAKFKKPYEKRSWWKFWSKSSKDPCPVFFVPFRDYGTKVYNSICHYVSNVLKNEDVKKQLSEIFKNTNCACERDDL